MAVVPDADLGADLTSDRILELFRFAYNDDQFLSDIAYAMWKAEGHPDGQHERHWKMAQHVAEAIAQSTTGGLAAVCGLSETAGEDIDRPRPIDYRMLTAIAEVQVKIAEEEKKAEIAVAEAKQKALEIGGALSEEERVLAEMFIDWKAASERHNDGNIRKSIEHNADRFA